MILIIARTFIAILSVVALGFSFTPMQELTKGISIGFEEWQDVKMAETFPSKISPCALFSYLNLLQEYGPRSLVFGQKIVHIVIENNSVSMALTKYSSSLNLLPVFKIKGNDGVSHVFFEAEKANLTESRGCILLLLDSSTTSGKREFYVGKTERTSAVKFGEKEPELMQYFGNMLN